MKASEYINELQKIIDEHGDLELYKYGSSGWTRIHVNKPIIAYKKILKGNQFKPDFFKDGFDLEIQKGEKVIRI